jgi:hypothetical protein
MTGFQLRTNKRYLSGNYTRNPLLNPETFELLRPLINVLQKGDEIRKRKLR